MTTMNNDPYIQFRLNEEREPEEPTDMDNTRQSNNVGNRAKKQRRGFTQMRGIWGRRESDGLLEVSSNEFGQPNDENGTKLSNFIGTLIRDGKNSPLMYPNWHKVPVEYKEDMWQIVKTKFNLCDSTKTWTMEKFGKKLRDWRNQLKSRCFKDGLSLDEQMKFKDPRVTDEHFKHLLKYWSDDGAKIISERNRTSRKKRVYDHTTGTKSFARVAKEQAKQLQKAPTRAELFKYCFTKKDGTQSKKVKNAITSMQEKEKEIINESREAISRNDSYAQVMGEDKNGRVGMYGAGVCPSFVFNDLSSRGANKNAIIKVLREENNELKNKLQQFNSQAVYVPRLETIDSDPTQALDDLSPILQVANREDWSLSLGSLEAIPLGSPDRTAQIGDTVCLKSILRPSKTVAVGVLYSTDPSKEVGGQELGHDHWEIYIQVAVVPEERLIRSCGQYKSIGDAVGDYIAWPKPFVVTDTERH